jgi:uncharacterized Zn-finger protein
MDGEASVLPVMRTGARQEGFDHIPVYLRWREGEKTCPEDM